MTQVQKRLTPKGAATRGRIVDAASGVIFERGVTGASLDEIRAAAKVSSSQLYHYFTDKQALVLAVIDHQTDLILANQQPALGQLNTIAGLRKWRDVLVALQGRLQCQGGCPIGTIGAQVSEVDPAARAEVAIGMARWEDAIRVGLTDMHARGVLRADPARLATAMLAALQGGLSLTQIRRSTEPLEAALDAMIDHVEMLTG